MLLIVFLAGWLHCFVAAFVDDYLKQVISIFGTFPSIFNIGFSHVFFLFLLLPFSLRLILSHGIFVLLVLEILWLHFSFSSIDFEFRFHLEVYDDWFKSGFFVLFFHSWIVNCLAISLGINFVRIIPWSNLF